MTDELDITIRSMRPADYDAVREVWAAVGLSIRPTGRDAEAAVCTQLQHFSDLYLVAEHAGRVVGVVFGTHDVRKGWINRLAVHPDHQRHGVGRRLLEACARGLDARGIGIVATLIEGENPASEALFTHAGYEAFGPIRYFRKRQYPGV